MSANRWWTEWSGAGRVSERAQWFSTLRRYLAFMAIANLAWETAHLPLYTIWVTGSPPEMAFAVLHCTGGDVLIALSTVMLALFLVDRPGWPHESYRMVAALTIACGFLYSIFSEWLNVELREAWAYRDLMPIVPVLDTGLSPLLQWLLIPLAAFWWAARPFGDSSEKVRIG